MFRELPLLDRFAAARQAGFDGVEIQFLAEGDPAEMALAARQAGIDVVLVNVGMGDFLNGGAGLSGVPGREQAFREELEKALEAARLLRARFVHVGPSRIPEGMSRADCLAVYRANLELASQLRAELGCTAVLLVEPLNRVDAPTALIDDVDLAADLLRDSCAGRVGLLFDVYHVAMNGHDVLERFRAHRDLIEHVQFSDVPGRQEPGAGTLDFAALLHGIESAGYGGWLGAEYIPRRPTMDTLDWLATFRKSE